MQPHSTDNDAVTLAEHNIFFPISSIAELDRIEALVNTNKTVRIATVNEPLSLSVGIPLTF
jgi:hypothetical protein